MVKRKETSRSRLSSELDDGSISLVIVLSLVIVAHDQTERVHHDEGGQELEMLVSVATVEDTEHREGECDCTPERHRVDASDGNVPTGRCDTANAGD